MARFRLGLAVLIGLLAAVALPALAQVPPHVPGTICFTPNFWCWASPPGPPGTQCGCATPYGFVPGIRG